jgi:hypothetical protein
LQSIFKNYVNLLKKMERYKILFTGFMDSEVWYN